MRCGARLRCGNRLCNIKHTMKLALGQGRDPRTVITVTVTELCNRTAWPEDFQQHLLVNREGDGPGAGRWGGAHRCVGRSTWQTDFVLLTTKTQSILSTELAYGGQWITFHLHWPTSFPLPPRKEVLLLLTEAWRSRNLPEVRAGKEQSGLPLAYQVRW